MFFKKRKKLPRHANFFFYRPILLPVRFFLFSCVAHIFATFLTFAVRISNDWKKNVEKSFACGNVWKFALIAYVDT